LKPAAIEEARTRLSPHITRTPVLQSRLLDRFLGCEFFFKYEGAQKIDAFKARGALNALLALQERKQLPEEVVAYSSGNHAQAVAWAAKRLGLKSAIYIPEGSSRLWRRGACHRHAPAGGGRSQGAGRAARALPAAAL
jgi:threonine dehydratase